MKRLLAIFILLPVAILIVALSLANRQPVRLSVPNFNGEALFAMQAPLFVVLFAILFIGMIIGSLGTWVRQSRHRRKSSERKVEATKAGFEAQKQRERADALAMEQGKTHAANDRAAKLGLPAPPPRRAA